MSANEGPVYLEDLENPHVGGSSVEKKSPTEPASAKDGNEKVVSSEKANPVASKGVKRQRTLMDMFTPVQPTQAAKKAKLENSDPKTTVKAANPVITGTQSLNSIPFSPTAYLNALSDEEKRLLTLEIETMGKSWLKILKDEIRKPYFIKLKRFLWDQGVKGVNDSAKNLKVYPAPHNIYSWSNLTPLGRVKVVIIGQDPYHGPQQAHGPSLASSWCLLLALFWFLKRGLYRTGLCFSVPQGVQVPPSLRNIFAEIKAEYPSFEVPKSGNLTSWAENGVLLLNTCLTVKAGEAGSHSNQGWEEFTDKVIDVVDKYGGANLSGNNGQGRGIVFLAWGAWAAKRVAKLDKKKHLILKSAHPSPLSAHRGFLGNGHFKQANDWLEQKYGPDGCVDWCKL
ncbi:uracil-DNA glycosylase [Panus rudis PR-1116 ss-1]|nr:uracil-DNA glycosylase [Panus rudis PR-1116 ss-1]